MKKWTFTLVSCVLITAVLASACTPFNLNRQEEPVPMQQGEEVAPTSTISGEIVSTTIELVAEDPAADTTAADLLKNSGADVEMTSYGDLGSFITSINGAAGDADNYWAFYVNDEYAQQAADKTMLKDGDRVKFVFEKVAASPL
ncbi:DUF4430 domain-containing protein [Candidatus Woesebacteria bacterium]|nr:DUF4430 domain-containing protein [Candidatus Woesebacteria bacterium]